MRLYRGAYTNGELLYTHGGEPRGLCHVWCCNNRIYRSHSLLYGGAQGILLFEDKMTITTCFLNGSPPSSHLVPPRCLLTFRMWLTTSHGSECFYVSLQVWICRWGMYPQDTHKCWSSSLINIPITDGTLSIWELPASSSWYGIMLTLLLKRRGACYPCNHILNSLTLGRIHLEVRETS